MTTLLVFVSDADSGRELACGTMTHSESGYFQFSYNCDYLEKSKGLRLSPYDLDETTPWREHAPYVLMDAEAGAWAQKVLVHSAVTSCDLTLKFFPVEERIGAVTFGLPEERVSASALRSDMEGCLALTQRIESGALPADAKALTSVATGVGGARPKALVELVPGEHAIAKFPSPNDTWPVVNCEFLGMRLARAVGLSSADVRLVDVKGHDILLVNRFDVIAHKKRHMFSALSALQLLDWEARHSSYPAFADFLFKYSYSPKEDCRELFARMILNMAIGNTDDHARNHAVFWDGTGCRLTPAYDVVVFPRAGITSSQAMSVGIKGSITDKYNCLSQCLRFGLTIQEAGEIHARTVDAVHEHWKEIADEARLSRKLRERLEGRAILPVSFR